MKKTMLIPACFGDPKSVCLMKNCSFSYECKEINQEWKELEELRMKQGWKPSYEK